MRKSKIHAAVHGGTADDVETQFYEAMHTCDLDRLMACWADDDDVVCVHAGGARLIGLGSIRSAFENMFTTGSFKIQPEHLHKVESISSAVHTLIERIEVMAAEGPVQAVLIATNVYHKTPRGWRMVAHHASAGSEQDMQHADLKPQVLH